MLQMIDHDFLFDHSTKKTTPRCLFRYFALSTTALKEYSINVGKWEAPDPDNDADADPYGGTGENSELADVEREVRQLL